MIEKLYRISCDKCGKSAGSHTEENHMHALNMLEGQGWIVNKPFLQFMLDDHPRADVNCPECAKERRE